MLELCVANISFAIFLGNKTHGESIFYMIKCERVAHDFIKLK